MDINKRMEQLGISLPPTPEKGGVYSPAKEFGKGLIYISGCTPFLDGNPIKGKLGKDFTVEEGQLYARNCMLNILAVLKDKIGDLNKVKAAVKILVFVASEDNFYDQPMVANGASSLLVEIFGEKIGLPSRSAIGVNVLPGNMPVEVEALFEVETE